MWTKSQKFNHFRRKVATDKCPVSKRTPLTVSNKKRLWHFDKTETLWI